MKLLIISDLHIGVENNGSKFYWSDKNFIQELSNQISENEIDSVILNGDIYELYQYSFEEIKKAKPELIKFLEHFYFIKGNHDITMPYGEDEFNYTNKEGKTIHIEHGHTADFLNGTIIGRTIGTAFFKFLRLIVKGKTLTRWYQKIMQYEEDMTRVPRKYNRYKYLNYALRLLKKYDVVILGHSHKIEYVKTWYIDKKKRYFNCGTCTYNRFQGIVFDTETLKYKTININEK